MLLYVEYIFAIYTMCEDNYHEKILRMLAKRLKRVSRVNAFENRLQSDELRDLLFSRQVSWGSRAQVIGYDIEILRLSVEEHRRTVQNFISRLSQGRRGSVQQAESEEQVEEEYLRIEQNNRTLEQNLHNIGYSAEDRGTGHHFQLIYTRFDPGQFGSQLCNNVEYNGQGDAILDDLDAFTAEVPLLQGNIGTKLAEEYRDPDHASLSEAEPLQDDIGRELAEEFPEQPAVPVLAQLLDGLMDVVPSDNRQSPAPESEDEGSQQPNEESASNLFESRTNSIYDPTDFFEEYSTNFRDPEPRAPRTGTGRTRPTRSGSHSRRQGFVRHAAPPLLRNRRLYQPVELIDGTGGSMIDLTRRVARCIDHRLRDTMFRRSLVRDAAMRARPPQTVQWKTEFPVLPPSMEVPDSVQIEPEQPPLDVGFEDMYSEGEDANLNLTQALQLDSLRPISVDINFQFVAGARSLSVEELKRAIREILPAGAFGLRFVDLVEKLQTYFEDIDEARTLSVHTCYIALLFVANEDTLRLTPTAPQDPWDILISNY